MPRIDIGDALVACSAIYFIYNISRRAKSLLASMHRAKEMTNHATHRESEIRARHVLNTSCGMIHAWYEDIEDLLDIIEAERVRTAALVRDRDKARVEVKKLREIVKSEQLNRDHFFRQVMASDQKMERLQQRAASLVKEIELYLAGKYGEDDKKHFRAVLGK
jgi:hypothetical protein